MSYNDDVPVGGIVAGVIGVVLLCVCLGVVIRACEVGNAATFDRAEQEIRTKNFKESTAYRAGLRRDFDELLLAYAKAQTDDERKVVLATIRHRAEEAPPDLVPQDVKDLLKKETKR